MKERVLGIFPSNTVESPESVVRGIARRTCKKYGTEEKLCVILEGLKGRD